MPKKERCLSENQPRSSKKKKEWHQLFDIEVISVGIKKVALVFLFPIGKLNLQIKQLLQLLVKFICKQFIATIGKVKSVAQKLHFSFHFIE